MQSYPVWRGPAGNGISEDQQEQVDAAIAAAEDLAVALPQVDQARDDAQDAAGQAAAARALAEQARILAEQARQEAEIYADAAAQPADFYDTIAAGRAAVADGATFGVRAFGSDGLTRPAIYRRDSASTQTLINVLASGTEIDELGIAYGDAESLLSIESRETGDVAFEIYQDGIVAGKYRIAVDPASGDLVVALASTPGTALRVGADGSAIFGGARHRGLSDREIADGKIWAVGDRYNDAANLTQDGLFSVGSIKSLGPVRVGTCVISPLPQGGCRIVSDAAPDAPFDIGADGSIAVGGATMAPMGGDGFAIGDAFGGDAIRITDDGRVLLSGLDIDLTSIVPRREIGDYPASVLRDGSGNVIPTSGNDNFGLRRFNPFSEPDTIYVVFAMGQSLQVLSPNMLRAPWEPESDFPKSVNGTTYASRADLYAAWAAQGITGLTDAQYAALEADYYRPLSTADRNPYPANLLMPSCGSLVNEQPFETLVPMAEYVKVTGIGNVGGTPGTESPACRMLWKMMELIARDFPADPLPTFVLVNVARGGSTMNNVGTGRLWYNDALRSLRKIKEIAAADGKKVCVPFYWYKGGEAEFDLTRYAVPGDAASGGLIRGQDYEALLTSISRERERFDEAVRSITDQTWHVRAMISQVQRGTTTNSGATAAALVPKVTQAQLDARKLPYCIFTAPMWSIPTNIYDYVHPTVVASTHDGERHGYIAYKAMCSVEGWQPLHIRQFYRTGPTTFEARFNRQIRFLPNDDYVEVSSLGPGRGLFMGQQRAGAPEQIAIASVAIKPDTADTVIISTVSEPTGYGIYLDNALHGTGGQSYNRTGCRSAIVGSIDLGVATFHPNDLSLGTTNVSPSEINNLGATATVYPDGPFPLFDLSAHQRVYLNQESA